MSAMQKFIFKFIVISFFLGSFWPATIVCAQQNYDTLLIPNLGLTSVQLRARNAICTDRAGKIWLGMNGTGIVHYDGSYWNLINSIATGGQLPSDTVTALHYATGQALWVGHRLGLTRFQNGNYTQYPFSAPHFPDTRLRYIVSNSQQVFVASAAGGVSVLTLSNGLWNSITTSNSTLPSDSINSLFVDQSGVLWIATSAGYSYYDGSSLTNVTALNSDLPGNKVLEIAVTPFDTLMQIQNVGLVRRFDNAHIQLDTMYFWSPTAGTIDFCNNNDFVDTIGISYGPPNVCSRFWVDGSANIFFLKNDNAVLGSGGYVWWYIDNTRMYYKIPYYDLNQTVSLGSANAYTYDLTSGDSLVVFRMVPSNIGLQYAGPNFVSGVALEQIPAVLNGLLPIPSSYKGGNQSDLVGNKVKARILNRGDLHWDPVSSVPYHEVPIGSNKNTVFASSIWLGGYDSGNQLYVAAQTYRQNSGNDFWPGPLDVNGESTPQVQSDFDYIWMLRRSDIDEFRYQYAYGNVQNGSYQVPSIILNWPAFYANPAYPQALAPFVDVNGDGQYNPLLHGDYPEVKGDQMAWCLFNDFGIKTETGSPVMGVEVHLSAFAFQCLDTGLLSEVLSFTTFYHYDLYNRGTKDFDSCYFGMWSDMDLGNAADDYVECDLPANAFFTFNGDSLDETSQGYGACPPIQNVQFLTGPAAPPNDGLDNNHNGQTDESGEELGLSTFLYYVNDFNPINGNPEVLDDYYQYLTGAGKNGQIVTFGGDGFGGGVGTTTVPTKFMFPGSSDPSFITPWTMASASITPSDMRGLGSMGPFSLPAGSKKSFDLAFVTGPSDSIMNQQVLMDLRNFFRNTSALNYTSTAPPITGPVSVASVTVTSYSVAMTNPSFTNYNWIVNGGLILSGQGTNTISVVWGAAGAGSVGVEISQSGISCKLVREIPVSIGTTGLQEADSQVRLRVYPNPSSGLVRLETDRAAEFIKVYSLQGQLLLSEGFREVLDLSTLSDGIYVLVITDKDERILQRTRVMKD